MTSYHLANLALVFVVFLSGYVVSATFLTGKVEAALLAPAVGLLVYLNVSFALALTVSIYSVELVFVALLVLSAALLICQTRRAPDASMILRASALVFPFIFACLAVLVFWTLSGVLFRATTLGHVDSLQYIMIGLHLQDQTFFEWVNTYQLWRRQLTVGFLHAPAALGGHIYLYTSQALVAVAVLGLTGWTLRRYRDNALPDAFFWIVVAIALAAFLSLNRFVMHATYLNGHLLTGLLMLAACIAGFPAFNRDRRERVYLTLVQSLSLIALIITRMEGGVLAALVLLPTLASRELSPVRRSIPLAALGIGLVAWNGFVFAIRFANDQSVASYVYMMGGVGSVLIIAAMVLISPLGRLIDRIPAGLIVGAPLAGSLALIAYDPANVVASVQATIANINRDWGYAIYGYLALCIMCAIFSLSSLARFIRFPILSYLPVMLIMGILRDNPFRNAPADSFNRALISIFPLMIILIVAAIMARQWDWPWRSGKRPPATP
ncbi:hypothetical protein [Glycocaulis sp.]